MDVKRSGETPRIPNETTFGERRAESAANLVNTFVRDRSLTKANQFNGTNRMYHPNRGTDPWKNYFKGLDAERLPSGGDTHLAALREFHNKRKHPMPTSALPAAKKPKKL